MVLNQPTFSDGTRIDLTARKSVFFADDLIVLLGSGIAGGDGTHSVETTLFQSFLEEPNAVPVATSTQLADPAGNGYYIPEVSQLRVFKGLQRSFRHDGKSPSRGNYVVAWLDHGTRPRGDSYEFAILVRGSDEIGRLAKRPEAYYRVICQTDSAHHVEFPKQRLSSFVFFEPSQTNHPLVARANTACLVMCRQRANGRISLGVTNPDLGLLEPDTPPPTYRFISENANQYLASRPRPVDIVLRGSWRCVSGERVTLVSKEDRATKLRFDCLHGMSARAELVPE
jgi:chondroitin-sulfate-ABC endolyase/exolyase